MGIETLIGLGIGAGLGAGKHVSDVKRAGKMRKAEAAKTRYSPWTGMQGKTVADPSLMGNLITGGAGGAMLGSSIGGMAGKTPTKMPGDELAGAPMSAGALPSRDILSSPGNIGPIASGKQYASLLQPKSVWPNAWGRMGMSGR